MEGPGRSSRCVLSNLRTFHAFEGPLPLYPLQQNTIALILNNKDAKMTGPESSPKFRDQGERRGKLKLGGGEGSSGLGLWRDIHWLVVWMAPEVIAELFHDSLHSLGLIKCLILNIAMKSV